MKIASDELAIFFYEICGNLRREHGPERDILIRMTPTAPSGVALLFDGVARLALIALAGLLPIFMIPHEWSSIAQSKMLLIAGLALVVTLLWAAARLFEGSMHLPRGALLYATLLLPMAYVVSAAATGFSGASLVGLGIEQDTLAAMIAWYAVFAQTALLFTGHIAGLRALVRAFALGLTALFAFQTLYIFFPAYFSLGVLQGATANVLGSWHDVGILSALGLFMSLALFRSGIFGGAWRALPVALGALSLFFLFVVHFTDVLWGAVVLLTLGWLVAMRAGLQSEGLPFMHALKRSAPFLVLAVLLGLAAAFGTKAWDKLPAPILITEVEVRPSWQGTLDVGRQSLGAPSSLLFGTGPNSFVREWGEHKPAGVNATPFWNSDFNYGVGIIPTSVFTAGLFGTIAWGAIVFVLLGLAWRFVRELRPLSTSRTLFGVLLAGVGFLVAFHFIYTPGPAVTSLMFILLGALAVVVAGDRPARVVSANTMLAAAVFACLVLLTVPVAFAGLLISKEVASNMYVNRAAVAYRDTGSAADASAMIETSLAISPRNDRAHRAASELGLVELSQLLAQGDPQTEEARTNLQNTLQNTIQHGLTAVEIDDANYQNWLLLAQVYGSLAGVNVEGAYEEARATYERAFEANPTNPVPKLRLAQLAATQGDIPAARAYLQEAVGLKQDFAAALFLLSQVEAADGKGEAAVQAAAAAVQIVPVDPLGWFNLGYILYAGGAYADAATALEQAIMRANDYSNAYFFLGQAYYRLGRSDEAVLALERVLVFNPNETWVQEGIDNIRAGTEPFPEEEQ